MTIPLKGLFGIMLKSHPQLRIPTGKRKTSRLFTKRGKFAPRITEKKFLQQPSRGFEPESSASKFPFLTAEPSCLHHVAIDLFLYFCTTVFKTYKTTNFRSTLQHRWKNVADRYQSSNHHGRMKSRHFLAGRTIVSRLTNNALIKSGLSPRSTARLKCVFLRYILYASMPLIFLSIYLCIIMSIKG